MNECDVYYGDKVELNDSSQGIIVYIGEISSGNPTNGKNKSGIYYGIRLESKSGYHNGTVKGRKYFECPPKHGIFVRLKDIYKVIRKSSLKQTRYHYNQQIYILNKQQTGIIKYIGLCTHLDLNTNNSDKLWFGVELNAKNSLNKFKSNGTIQKIVYFKSSKNCNALFIQKSNISLPPKSKKSKVPKNKPPSIPSNKKRKKKKKDRRSSVFDMLKNKIAGNGNGNTGAKSKNRESRSRSTTTKPIRRKRERSRSRDEIQTPKKSMKKKTNKSTNSKKKKKKKKKNDKNPSHVRHHSLEDISTGRKNTQKHKKKKKKRKNTQVSSPKVDKDSMYTSHKNNIKRKKTSPYTYASNGGLPVLVQKSSESTNSSSVKSPKTPKTPKTPKSPKPPKPKSNLSKKSNSNSKLVPTPKRKRGRKPPSTPPPPPRRSNTPTMSKRRKRKDKERKPSLVDRAKSMMNALPFSSSSDIENNNVIVMENSNSAFMKRQNMNGNFDRNMNKKKNKKKKSHNRRSQTRDVSSIAMTLNHEQIENKIVKNKKKRKNNKSYGGRHANQRSKSMEFNADELIKHGIIDDENSKQMSEYSFSSSSENDSLSSSDSDTSDSKDEEEDDDSLSLFVGTWNVGESEFILDSSILRRFLGSNSSNTLGMHDIYVIGLQECVSQHRKAWINGILAYLDNGKKQFIILQKSNLMNICEIVIVNRLYITRIRDIKCKTIACGKGNIIGNKGAVVITFSFDETTFAFINVHLVARAERVIQRNENIERIFKNILNSNIGIFDKIDVLNQFNHVIFFGDLNYRITDNFYKVCDLIKHKKYNKFAKFDQLNQQKIINNILYAFNEGNINEICPTYRWDRKRNIVSNKREQTPSYTDRILHKSLNNCYSFWQTKYKSCMKCFGSDHRPIIATFKFIPLSLPRHTKKQKKFENIQIGFYELKAYFNNNIFNNGLDINDKICLNLYYNYCNNNECLKLADGYFDDDAKCWIWNLKQLDQIKIIPYILNPQFLCQTYVYIQIINDKNSNVIGYANISLFNVFPNSLVNTQKIKNNFNRLNKNNASNQSNCYLINDKEFNAPITVHGTYVGDIKGFVHAQSELVEKHRKISMKHKYK